MQREKNLKLRPVEMVRYVVAVCAVSFLACSTQAEKIEYRYELKQGKGKPVCEHMTKVFNEKFRAPWIDAYAIQRIEDAADKYPGESRTVFGKLLKDVFERLPGVGFDPESVFAMLYSKYPESQEFDAVQWRDWSYQRQGEFSKIPVSIAVLVAELDIDNDGQKEWVVKHGFMHHRPTNYVSPNGNADQAGSDGFSIFSTEALDTHKPFLSAQMAGNRKSEYQPRRLDGYGDEVGQMIRPFIFGDRTYLAAYRPQWLPESKRPRQVSVRTYAPDIEQIAIVEVKPDIRLIGLGPSITAKTEQLCLMHMLPLRQHTSMNRK